MTALTKDRNTARRSGDEYSHPVAASTKIFAGSLVALNATGYAAPGSAVATLKSPGRAEEQVDNSAGANGAKTVTVSKGTFKWANHGTNTLNRTHIGSTCYIEDDQTVGSSATGKSAAGTVMQIDSDGVWVRSE